MDSIVFPFLRKQRLSQLKGPLVPGGRGPCDKELISIGLLVHKHGDMLLLMLLLTTTMMTSIFEPHPKYNLYHLSPCWASCPHIAGFLLSTLASLQSVGSFIKVSQITSPSCPWPSKNSYLQNACIICFLVRTDLASCHRHRLAPLPNPDFLAEPQTCQTHPCRAPALAVPSARGSFSRSWLRSLPPFIQVSAQVTSWRAFPAHSL